jgi:excisionase family DNA binding protein
MYKFPYRRVQNSYLKGFAFAMAPGKARKRTVLPEATPIGVLYTTEEVAQLLKVTTRAVQKWVREGKLPAVKYGRVLRIRAEDLQQFGRDVGR